MQNKTYLAKNVLEATNNIISSLEKDGKNFIDTGKLVEVINLFDWWEDEMSLKDLKEVKLFLEEAIKLGYTGHVCFKYSTFEGANGMWAHKEEKEIRHDFLYKTFSSRENYWIVYNHVGNGETELGNMFEEYKPSEMIYSIEDLENYHLNK